DLSYDSRKISDGALFVALRGSDFDGHRFVASAVANGAAAVLVEEEMPVAVPQIIVPGSSRAALAQVACTFYGDPSHELTVIGITGTDGKTTTTAMLESILNGTGRQAGAIGTVGVRIGDGTSYDLGHQTTPESNHVQRYLREMVTAGTTHAVIEATSHGLVTHRLDGVRFAAGGVTNITHEHLEFHKTIENYRRAKATLLERTGEVRGVVVINNDDVGARSVVPYATGARVVTYGLEGEVDLRAEHIDHAGTGVSFDVVAGDDITRVELPMAGMFNVSNALCAIGLATGCGVRLEEAARALSQATPVSGRMQPIDAGQPFRVIVDYAHTPESLRTILSLLRAQYRDGRLIVVTGSAGERDVEKRPMQGEVCARIADVTIVTSEDPRNEDPDAIIDEIVVGAERAGAVRGESVRAVTHRRDALRAAFEIARPGDCVLLAGKGHETSIIWGYEHVPWNEAAIAEELLREMIGS
ncbi:MAG TPA: UDP-N-acetylmuramoyl-L-alanyl-D-glutamate--2,6-diaminopimelate ligase, partial [Thermomicrobiales bacterium]|nr:UDP-N-acetylmuramoyl-L-alanyl-D-glutamate--2,6-diaminopimelate ligase [Thermomicrobiales bacterium]